MRRALLRKLPALTRFTFGALNPLTVEDYTYAELNEYVTQMEQAQAREPR
jgi:hypothetical protein